MKDVLAIRLEIIRSVRADKLAMLDKNIQIALENGEDISELKAHKQRLRDITEPYKALMKKKKLERDDKNVMLSHEWDAFTSVNWN